MRPEPAIWLAAALVVLVAACPGGAAQPRVDLEIATEPNFLNTESRAWSEMLTQAGFSSVRLRGGGADSPSLRTMGTPQAPAYSVVGLLTANNQLILPKGKFGLRDRGPIEQWLNRLREGGEDAINLKPVAYGLLPKQLETVYTALTIKVEGSTRGKLPREAAKAIADRLPLKFVSDAGAQQALAAGETVGDELQGLTSGTSLAAILRPLGLVLVPERSGSELRLRIGTSGSAKEFWPVGWPPKGNPSETMPELFKYLKLEVVDTPLAEAVTAIAGRMKAPVLLDHNALARSQVDLNKKVSHSAASVFYARGLDRLLFEARLKYELRVDEADKPFFWITTLKQ